MTVLMHDAVAELSVEDQRRHREGELGTLLYADDTLLVGYQGPPLQAFIDAVAGVGQRYCLELHWGKFQLLQIRAAMDIKRSDGESIEVKDAMVYLGTTLTADGPATSEVNRRIGRAWAEFTKLARFWKHANVSTVQKIRIYRPPLQASFYTACVRSGSTSTT